MTDSEEKESRFPFRKGVTEQLPLASYSAKPPAGKGQTPPSTDTADIKLQSPLKLVSFHIPKTPRKRLPSKGEESKKKKKKKERKNKALSRHLPCSRWDVKSTSSLGTQDRDLSSLGLGA